MFSRITLLFAAAIGLLAIVLTNRHLRVENTINDEPQPISGRNNTLLFIVNEHPGLSNVHMASAQALLENHPHITIHVASFPIVEKTVGRISTFAKRQQPESKAIIFHALSGPSYIECLQLRSLKPDEDGKSGLIAAPGLEAMTELAKNMPSFFDPYTVDEHAALYHQLTHIIRDVDPAVIVLDTSATVGIEATRATNRLHAFVTANMLIDSFPEWQPRLGWLWKYPAMASGYPFPVPLSKILPNIYMNLLFVSKLMRSPILTAKRKALAARGVHNPNDILNIYRQNAPHITQTTFGATIPVEVIPPNVTCTGPINLSAAPAEEQDLELAQWISKGRTVLINMGSGFTYSRTHTRHMVGAIQTLLDTTDLQILWKFRLAINLRDFDWKTLVKPLLATGRVRVEEWLSIDPSSLLALDSVVTFVTHGGAGGFHDSIGAGVPQVILPMWVDLYRYAQLAEQIGVGIWGCRDSSPDWTSQCLSADITRVASSPESPSFLAKAQEIRANATRNGRGKDIAAKVLAQLAGSGRA